MSERGEHETRDVPASVPVYVIAFTAVFVPLGALAMWLMMETVWRAPPEPEPVFPEEPPRTEVPPLQTSPPADMARFAEHERRRISEVGWVDREQGIVRMPVDRAMDLIAERGLPGPQSGPAPPPARESVQGSQQGGQGP